MKSGTEKWNESRSNKFVEIAVLVGLLAGLGLLGIVFVLGL